MRKNRGTAYGVIGLGRFGTALAIALAQAGKEVIAIDRSEEKIKNIRRYTDYAFVAENLSMETLKEIGIQNCDVAIICIGEKICGYSSMRCFYILPCSCDIFKSQTRIPVHTSSISVYRFVHIRKYS